MSKNGIGVIYQLSDVLTYGTEKLSNFDIDCVQIQCFDHTLFTAENAKKVKEALDGKLRASSFWCGWTGPMEWNFTGGPSTLGIVPEAYREERVKQLKKGAEFASMLGINMLTTHAGFIPENPSDKAYIGVRDTISDIVAHCKSLGITFNFETGQETPVTLMRLITDLKADNVGMNFDPANIMMYGKGNPVDAIDIFKGYINSIHAKDGDYPTEFYSLGNERVVGEGSVNYPVFLPKLIRSGFTGDIFIEREISGEQQVEDIKKTIKYIKNILADC